MHTPSDFQHTSEVIGRKYLKPDEVEQLISTCFLGQNKVRDKAILMVMHQHGLRASELLRLKWCDFDFTSNTISIRRAKNGLNGVHPITPRLRSLMLKYRREQQEKSPTAATEPLLGAIFTTSTGKPLSQRGLYAVVQRAGIRAGLGGHLHPHMLRHAAGYKLINDGVDIRTVQVYLGHKSISSTAIYTELNHAQFVGLFE